MAGPADLGRVAGDSAVAFHYRSSFLVHRVAQLPAAIVTVHRTAQPVAHLGIGGGGRPCHAAGEPDPERRALQDDEGFAHRETQPRIEAERAVVVARLH
jgi:hypothetical protein